jgi:hypothetical protein
MTTCNFYFGKVVLHMKAGLCDLPLRGLTNFMCNSGIQYLSSSHAVGYKFFRVYTTRLSNPACFGQTRRSAPTEMDKRFFLMSRRRRLINLYIFK